MRSSTIHRKVASWLMLFWCVAVSWGLLPTLSAQAATYTVTTLDDHNGGSCTANDCTLREALAYAPAGSTLIFQTGLAGTLTLKSTLTINHDVTVIGPDSGVSLSGNDQVKVLNVTGGSVTLQNLTIADGLGASAASKSRDGSSGEVGGLDVSGSSILTLDACTIASNKGGAGSNGYISYTYERYYAGAGATGGIGVSGSARVLLTNCTLAQNIGGKGGAGVDHAIDGFVPGGAGGTGGISVTGGTLSMINTTFASNTGGAGGDVKTVITNKGAGVGGTGGISVTGGTLSVTNTTLASNTGRAGGTASKSGAVSYADNGVGGLQVTGGSASATNTIIANNNGKVANVSGSLTAGSYNLIDGDAQLAPLQDNGGPTQTMALLAGSPAIDAGDPILMPAIRSMTNGAPATRGWTTHAWILALTKCNLMARSRSRARSIMLWR